MRIDINQPYLDGHIDHALVEPSGQVTLHGWSPRPVWDVEQPPTVHLDGVEVPHHQVFRTLRPDVAAAPTRLRDRLRRRRPEPSHAFLGLNITYLDPAFGLPAGHEHVLRIRWEGFEVERPVQLTFQAPHYDQLLHTDEVAHREHIYGSGPPTPANDPEIVALAQRCTGSTLDFGCGSGYIVRTLRERGIEAHGVELDRPQIHQALTPDIRPHVTLYDGEFPLPFDDGAFDTVFSSEVIEHIPDYETALAEVVRVSREQLVLTVPDASGIPAGFPHGVVPWHLLESTHFNFFTQDSLQALLEPHFAQLEFARVGAVQVNGSRWWTSIGVVCSDPRG